MTIFRYKVLFSGTRNEKRKKFIYRKLVLFFLMSLDSIPTIKVISSALNAFTIPFVLLPVGHLTSSITVPDVFTSGTAECFVAFEAVGAIVGH